jgi:hypothetical protein
MDHDLPSGTRHALIAALRDEVLSGSDQHGEDQEQRLPDVPQEHIDLIVLDSVLAPTVSAALAEMSGTVPHAQSRAREAMTAGLERGLRDNALDNALLPVVLAEQRIKKGQTRDELAAALGLPLDAVAAMEGGGSPIGGHSPATTAAWISAVEAPHARAVNALRRSLLREHATEHLAPAAGDSEGMPDRDVEGYVAEVERLIATGDAEPA